MSIKERASGLFCQFWEWRLNNGPEFATSIGVHKYDDRLDEMNLNSYLRRKEEGMILLRDAKELKNESQTNTEDFPPATVLNLELLVSNLEQCLTGMDFKPHVYSLNNLEGPQLDFPRLLSWMKQNSVEDFTKILKRMHLFPQQINETIFLLREGMHLGLTMHKVSIDSLPKVLKNIAEQPAADSPVFKPFMEKPKDILVEEWNPIVIEAKKIIDDQVKSSYLSLSKFIEDEYLIHTRSSVGSSSLPNGLQYYAACLKFHTTTTLTPKEVQDIGVKEVERITQRMIEVKEQVKYEGSLKDFRLHLRTNEKFNFKDAAEIVSHYSNICKQIEGKLHEYFEVLPKAPYEVTPVPPDVAPTFPAAYYLAPPDSGDRPGTFYINTYKAENRKRYEAVSLSLHEAVPGHHLQTCLTMESGSSPDFRRFMEDRKYYEVPGRFAMNTGYIEGWGLYSEYLGEEMALYTDPFDMFGRLSNEMLRACRLVVDTGMHAFGWSRERAIQYMEENTAMGSHEITSEIDRYITWPGQACGYKIGEIKIKELRKKAEEQLGERFDIRKFHHHIASMGGVPLNILEEQIDIFIKDQLV